MAYSFIMESPQLLLKQYGLKSTPGRVHLLETLLNSPHPLSVEKIFYETKKIVDLSTVYRTLNEFVTKGIVNAVSIEKDKLLYEMHHGRPHHHHIVCTTCSNVEDVTLCELDQLSRKILSKSQNFTNITKHSLEFFGVCNKCSKKSLS